MRKRMLRFYSVIIKNLPRIWMIPKMAFYARNPGRYSEEFRYQYDVKAIRYMMKAGRIHTNGYGQEHLPKEGGYVMVANHQGKYDALGIMYTHRKPCTVVIDDERSHGLLVQQFVDLVQGKRIRLDDIRQAAGIIREISQEVKQGRKFIIFPSGGYKHRNGNYVDPFKAGTFKSAMKAHAPIVPVALIDSWKVFDLWSIRKVTTQVYYLKPLYYEDYKDMKSVQIAEQVYKRICDCIYYAARGETEKARNC